jgi:DNA-binding transcriptional ArsR family regulator
MLIKDILKEQLTVNDEACGELMKEQDFCVSDIAEIVEEGKISNISQQLKILTMSNIISRYRVEKRVFYKLEDERIRTIVDFLHKQFM